MTPESSAVPVDLKPELSTPGLPPGIPTWSRLLARTFDMLVETFFVFFVAAFCILFFRPDFIDWLNEGYNVFILNLFLQPVVCLVDAAIYQLFGNTPGKALLDFSVSKTDGTRLTFKEYFLRNFAVWSTGNAYGLPVYCLIANATQYTSLKHEGTTMYDKTGGYRFNGIPPSRRRSIFILILIVIIAVSSDFRSSVLDEEDDSEVVEDTVTVL